MFRPIKVTFHLDGTGVYYDPSEPPMLAGLLAAALVRHHVHGEPPARDEVPIDVPLPLQRWRIAGTWGWHASALFPDGAVAEGMEYWRKRFRVGRTELIGSSPNTVQGTYRDWNTPYPLLLCQRMVAYAVGERRKIQRELRRAIKHIGKKRAHGRGHIIGIDVKVIDIDRSLVIDGAAAQYLPLAGGARMVRPRPPYWSSIDRVACCEIGELYPIEDDK